MIIKINGKENSVETKMNLHELITDKKLSPEKIVVEHNFNIVPQDKWQDIVLDENDTIEIVSFVAGG